MSFFLLKGILKGVVKRVLWVSIVCFGITGLGIAQVNTNSGPLQFTSDEQEVRFHHLASELRCVMCQNQSLADSNAQIAIDMRHEIFQRMQSGETDEQIKEFLVSRYGDFVLYKPELNASTGLLWFGPFVLLVFGALMVVWVVRKRRPVVDDAPTDDSSKDWL